MSLTHFLNIDFSVLCRRAARSKIPLEHISVLVIRSIKAV